MSKVGPFHCIIRIESRSLMARNGQRFLRWRFIALRADKGMHQWSLAFWLETRRFSVKPQSTNYHGANRMLRQMIEVYGAKPATITGRSVADMLRKQLSEDDIVACTRAAVQYGAKP